MIKNETVLDDIIDDLQKIKDRAGEFLGETTFSVGILPGVNESGRLNHSDDLGRGLYTIMISRVPEDGCLDSYLNMKRIADWVKSDKPFDIRTHPDPTFVPLQTLIDVRLLGQKPSKEKIEAEKQTRKKALEASIASVLGDIVPTDQTQKVGLVFAVDNRQVYCVLKPISSEKPKAFLIAQQDNRYGHHDIGLINSICEHKDDLALATGPDIYDTVSGYKTGVPANVTAVFIEKVASDGTSLFLLDKTGRITTMPKACTEGCHSKMPWKEFGRGEEFYEGLAAEKGMVIAYNHRGLFVLDQNKGKPKRLDDRDDIIAAILSDGEVIYQTRDDVRVQSEKGIKNKYQVHPDLANWVRRTGGHRGMPFFARPQLIGLEGNVYSVCENIAYPIFPGATEQVDLKNIFGKPEGSIQGVTAICSISEGLCRKLIQGAIGVMG